MRVFFDTEFTGLHQNTMLISLGLIDEVGRTFYAELNDYDRSQVNGWLEENVVNKLKHNEDEEYYVASRFEDNPVGQDLYLSYSVDMKGNKEQVKKELLQWLSQYDCVEWITDVGHYDFVLLVDLICCNALDMPPHLPASYYDINQALVMYFNCDVKAAFNISREQLLASFDVTIEEEKHNALYDAKVIREIYLALHN